MALQYKDSCVLWVKEPGGKWVRFLNCRSREIANVEADRLFETSTYYKMGETVKILSPKVDPSFNRKESK